MITPSELLQIILIDFIITTSRKANPAEEFLPEEKEEKEEKEDEEEDDEEGRERAFAPIETFLYQLLAYLGKTITYQTHLHYPTIQDFQFKWISILKETNYLFFLLDKANTMMESLDSLIDFCDNLKNYFESNTLPKSAASPQKKETAATGAGGEGGGGWTENGLICPNKISLNSAIGLFLRKMMIEWSMSHFDDQCNLFEQFQIFLQQSEQLTKYQCDSLQEKDIQQYLLYRHIPSTKKGSAGDKQNGSSYLPVEPTLLHYIQETELSLQQKNFPQAEDVIHDYFDGILNNHYPIMLFSPESTSSSAKQQEKEKDPTTIDAMEGNYFLSSRDFQQHTKLLSTIEKQLKELTHQSTMNNYGVLKHQHSMISLAVVWISAKNYRYAQLAIEEALKTAHQRGDHPTVIKCLLLLYEIYEKTCANQKNLSNSSNTTANSASTILNAMTNPEELLKRCIEKSGSLLLQDIFNESMIKFIDLKIINLSVNSSKEESTVTTGAGAVVGSTSSPTVSSTTADWTMSQLFNLLSFTTYNETSLTLKYCLFKTITHLEDISGTGPNLNNNNPAAAAAANHPANKNANSTVIERLALNEKYFQQYYKFTLLQNSLWNQLATVLPERNTVNFLLLTNLYRLLQLYGRFYSYQQLAQILTKFLMTLSAALLQKMNEKEMMKDEQIAKKQKKQTIKILILIYQRFEQFNKQSKRIAFHEKYEDLSNQITNTSTPLYSSLDCTLNYLLFLIAYLKGEITQSLHLLEKILIILEVKNNLQTLQKKNVITEYDSQFYERDVFINTIYNFEETVKVYLIQKLVEGKMMITGKNHFVNQLYCRHFCDYYQMNYLLSDSMFAYFYN